MMKYNVDRDINYSFDVIKREAKLCEQQCELVLVTDHKNYIMEHIPSMFSLLHWLDEEDPLCQRGYIALEKYAEVSMESIEEGVLVNALHKYKMIVGPGAA